MERIGGVKSIGPRSQLRAVVATGNGPMGCTMVWSPLLSILLQNVMSRRGFHEEVLLPP